MSTTDDPENPCPSITELLDFASWKISGLRKSEIAVHGAFCGRCEVSILGIRSWLMANHLLPLEQKPLVMLSDEVEAARPEASREATSALYRDPKVAAMPPDERLQHLSKKFGIPIFNVKEAVVPQDVLDLVPQKVCRNHWCVPVRREGCSLILCMAEPSNIFAMDDIKFVTGYNVEVAVATDTDIMEAIERLYGPLKEEAVETIG